MSIQLKVSHDRLRSFDGSILKLGRQLVDSPIAVGLQLKAPVNTISDTSVAEAGRGEFPSMLENRAPNSSPRFPWSCTNLRKRATIKASIRRNAECKPTRHAAIRPIHQPTVNLTHGKTTLPELSSLEHGFITRLNVTPLRSPDTPQYVMCGKAIGREAPEWCEVSSVQHSSLLRHHGGQWRDVSQGANIGQLKSRGLTDSAYSTRTNFRRAFPADPDLKTGSRATDCLAINQQLSDSNQQLNKKRHHLRVVTQAINVIKQTGRRLKDKEKKALSSTIDRLLQDDDGDVMLEKEDNSSAKLLMQKMKSDGGAEKLNDSRESGDSHYENHYFLPSKIRKASVPSRLKKMSYKITDRVQLNPPIRSKTPSMILPNRRSDYRDKLVHSTHRLHQPSLTITSNGGLDSLGKYGRHHHSAVLTLSPLIKLFS